MPGQLILNLVLYLTVSAGSIDVSQAVFGGSLQPRIVEGEALKLPGSFYIGGYSSPGGGHVVHFYSVRDPADLSPEGVPYVSIPFAIRLRAIDAATELREWADGRSCPALYGVMYEFSRLAPPLFDAPRLTAEPAGSSRLGAATMRIHSSVVSVWGYARQADGVPMSMTLAGTDGIIDRWVRFAENQLAECWSGEQPSFAPVAD